MNEESSKYKKIIGYSFTELFLICSLATLSFFIRHNIGYDKGIRNIYYELRQNKRPTAVITRDILFFDQKEGIVKEGKSALIVYEFNDIPFKLEKDESLSKSRLEVFVSQSMPEEEKEALIDYLENTRD